MSRLLVRLRSWIRAVAGREAHEREIDEELRFHLEREIESLMRQGISRGEARRRAHAEFGSLTALREECREARGTRLLDSTFQDLRYGLRMAWRYPASSLAAVATLALTIGAIATVLTLVDTFLWSRWPAERPHEIVEVQLTRDHGARQGRASWADYEHFRDRTETLRRLVAVYPTAPLHVSTDREVVDVNGAVVSAGLFPMLGLQPEFGRFFRPDEDAVPGRDPVVVLGHDFWQRFHGGDSEVLGERLRINGRDFTIVGVSPATFRGFDAQPVDLWLPTMMLDVGYRWCSVLENPDCTILRLYGRRAPGASTAAVAAEMESLHPERWDELAPDDRPHTRVREVRGFHQSDADRRFLTLLPWIAGVLFLLCCANLGGLMLARSRKRSAELAARASLGASRGRLVRQLLTEALLLAGVGGALGILVSAALTRFLQARFYTVDSSGRSLAYEFSLNPRIVVATVVVTALAGVLFGLLPALGLTRRPPRPAREARAGHMRNPTQQVLLGLQAAAAMALIVVGALLVASAGSRDRVENLDVDRVALMRLRPRLIGYGPDEARPYLQDVVARLQARPGVESVSMVGSGIALMGFAADVSVDGEARAASSVGYIEVGPRYFETLGTPVLSGREFSRADDSGAAPVAVVSQALARSLWPGGGDPVGASIRVNEESRTVVGVVADVPLQARGEPRRPYVYVPFWQADAPVDARLQVRVFGSPQGLLPDLVREARRVDPRVPVTETITLEHRIAGMFRPLWLSAVTVGYAATLAILLAALGLYGSLAAAVSHRTREIGLRQALGASARGILALIAGQGLRVVVAGAMVGGGTAWVATRLLRHLLYGTASGDWPVYVVAAAAVLAVGAAASLIPARRAAAIDPMPALRTD